MALPPHTINKPENQRLAEIRKLMTNQNGMEQALQRLVSLSPAEFDEVVRAQVQLNKWISSCLLHHPHIMPNQVDRALRLSQTRFGLPWWLTEAQYRRIRFQANKETK